MYRASKCAWLYLLVTLCMIASHICLCIDGKLGDVNSRKHQLNKQELEVEWSEWSAWSLCSRPCDGGISSSLRQCLSKSGCKGGSERHRICNMQPCAIPTDFRQQQCSAFNSRPYRDRYYEWLSFIDLADPCSLTCKAKGLNFVAKLATRVKDGTRCRPGALDMCLAGKCLNVGCNLQLGSSSKVDECGICGGDSLSCKKYSYNWSHSFQANCSRPCGGGIERSSVVCVNNDTQEVVDNVFCSGDVKPEAISRTCNKIDCQPEWTVGEWSRCDKKCGVGTQTRQVTCVVERMNAVKETLPDLQCAESKPYHERKCNTHECPQWYEGQWSECSESCGNGIQTRHVVCRDHRGFFSDKCELVLKPTDKRNCTDITRCLRNMVSSQEDSPSLNPPNKLIAEPSFEIGQWSACNVSCGMGFQTRNVECKIYLEYSKTFLSIPKDQCPGEMPNEVQECFAYECHTEVAGSESANEVLQIRPNKFKYSWRVIGFTKCSAFCLGGTQESIIKCIDTANNRTVNEDLCNQDLKPEFYTKTCNDFPCKPRWNVTNFGECTKACGRGGYQARTVRCVHEIARGTVNFVIVPDDECKDPIPSLKRACNQVDCPAKWHIGGWEKCNKECDGGVKIRHIRCMKDTVEDGPRAVSHLDCASVKKPKIMKSCNLRPCQHALQDEKNEATNRKSKRNNEGYAPRHHERKLFRVQGKAIVFEGDFIKLACPEWNPRKNLSIIWLKNNNRIESSRKHHLIKNVLKIRNIKLTDTGVYKCTFGDTVHSMFLHALSKQKNSSFKDFGNFILSDRTHESTLEQSKQDNYYKTELDVSREMEKYSSRINSPLAFEAGFETRKSNTLISTSTTATSITTLKSSKERAEQVTNFNNKMIDHHPVSKLNTEEFWFADIRDLEDKYVTYNWITTSWSKCTISCGGRGFRIRFSQCYIKTKNAAKIVDASRCINSGLEKPTTIEACGLDECPVWKVGSWSECDNCIQVNRGLQSRSVNCMLVNGTILDESLCAQLDHKPLVSQECPNNQCQAIWNVTTWSKCNAACHENGYRTRTVQCVWRLTGKVADPSHCHLQPKPDLVEPCFNACDLLV